MARTNVDIAEGFTKQSMEPASKNHNRFTRCGVSRPEHARPAMRSEGSIATNDPARFADR